MGDARTGWDPLRESLCSYVHRLRTEEQMDDYDDQAERRLEQGRALGLYWAREAPADPNQLTLGLTVHDETAAA